MRRWDDAIRAHGRFIRENAGRLTWFLIICGIHFFGIMLCDAIVRSAIADRLGALSFGNSSLRVSAELLPAGCWLRGFACFVNAKQAALIRKNGSSTKSAD